MSFAAAAACDCKRCSLLLFIFLLFLFSSFCRFSRFICSTGRPRRCGWLDIPVVQYSHMLNRFASLNITKLDVLSHLDQIKIGTVSSTVLPFLPVNRAAHGCFACPRSNTSLVHPTRCFLNQDSSLQMACLGREESELPDLLLTHTTKTFSPVVDSRSVLLAVFFPLFAWRVFCPSGVSYTLDGKVLPPGAMPSTLIRLSRVQVQYETLPGWRCDISKARTLEELPREVQYCTVLHGQHLCPVSMSIFSALRARFIICDFFSVCSPDFPAHNHSRTGVVFFSPPS